MKHLLLTATTNNSKIDNIVVKYQITIQKIFERAKTFKNLFKKQKVCRHAHDYNLLYIWLLLMRQPQYYIFMENSWWCCCCCFECTVLQYYVYIIIIYVADFRKCTRLRMRFVNAVVCDRFVFTVACDSIFPIFRWCTTSSRITLQYYHIHRYSLQQQQNIDNNLSITLRERYFQTPFSRWRRWRWSVYLIHNVGPGKRRISVETVLS